MCVINSVCVIWCVVPISRSVRSGQLDQWCIHNLDVCVVRHDVEIWSLVFMIKGAARIQRRSMADPKGQCEWHHIFSLPLGHLKYQLHLSPES